MDEFDGKRFPGNFYPGMIMRLDRTRRRGVIRSHSGKEIPFEFRFVTILGPEIGQKALGIEALNEGDSVGFDVGWTSRGLRVTIIRPKPASDAGQESKPPPDSEDSSGSGNSGQNEH
jgi:hypothetical protein